MDKFLFDTILSIKESLNGLQNNDQIVAFKTAQALTKAKSNNSFSHKDIIHRVENAIANIEFLYGRELKNIYHLSFNILNDKIKEEYYNAISKIQNKNFPGLVQCDTHEIKLGNISLFNTKPIEDDIEKTQYLMVYEENIIKNINEYVNKFNEYVETIKEIYEKSLIRFANEMQDIPPHLQKYTAFNFEYLVKPDGECVFQIMRKGSKISKTSFYLLDVIDVNEDQLLDTMKKYYNHVIQSQKQNAEFLLRGPKG